MEILITISLVTLIYYNTYQSNFHQTSGNFQNNKFGNPQGNQGNNANQGYQRTNNSLSNQNGHFQRNPLPSSSQQAIVEPVITTPSSIDLPISGPQTPQILDQKKVMRYERVSELAHTILKEGATQAIILLVIANLKSSLFLPYHHHIEMLHHPSGSLSELLQ